MTRIGPVRRGALLVTGLVAAAAAAVGGSLATGTASQASSVDARAGATHATRVAARRTTVAFLVGGCNRCHVRLYQAVRGREHVWESRAHRVRNGRVSFDVATRHTHGLSASVSAPWEGNTGAVTQIAFRYAHQPVGSIVSAREASRKHRASGCWAGTTRRTALLDLTVRRVRVPGVDGSPTTAARAWISTTPDWWQPMLRADKGVLGSQDVIFCERPTPAQRQAAHRTDLTLVMKGCDRCSVQLVHAIDGQADHVWTSRRQRVGSDQRVDFDLRTGLTHGLSFVLDAPWAGNAGAVPNLVTRYAGHRVGTLVDRDAARHARRAEGCWAGTRAASARLTFRIQRVRVRTVDGQPARAPLAYSPHALPSWQPMVRTYRGTIGNQDAFYCQRP